MGNKKKNEKNSKERHASELSAPAALDGLDQPGQRHPLTATTCSQTEVTPRAPPNCVFICQPEMGDPLTLCIGFMRNPAPFRFACRFTVRCFNHAAYLEGIIPCPYVTYHIPPQDPEEEEEPEERFAPLAWGKEYLLVQEEARPHTAPGQRELKFKRVSYQLHVTGLPQLTALATLGVGASVNAVHISRLPRLVAVQDMFMSQFFSAALLRVVTLHDLPLLRDIGTSCWAGCNLEQFHMSDLPALETVGDRLLCGCHQLTTFRMTNLPKLTHIGENCLAWCLQLKDATFSNLPELVSVKKCWLHQCRQLEAVSFLELPNLGAIGDDFLSWSSALRTVELTDLPELESIGSNCLRHCIALQSITLSRVPSLDFLGPGFLTECPSLLTVRLDVHSDSQALKDLFPVGDRKK